MIASSGNVGPTDIGRAGSRLVLPVLVVLIAGCVVSASDSETGGGGAAEMEAQAAAGCRSVPRTTWSSSRYSHGASSWQSCSGDATATGFTVQGSISGDSADGFLIDACANVVCDAPDVYGFHIDTGDVPVSIPDGTYVELVYRPRTLGMYQSCADVFWLRNVPAIAGIPNPTEPGEGLWLLSDWSYGSQGAEDSPVLVAASEYGDFSCDGLPYGYAHFVVLSARDDPAKSIRLGMGESATWTPETPLLPGSYTARDRASFNGGETQVYSTLVARAPSTGP